MNYPKLDELGSTSFLKLSRRGDEEVVDDFSSDEILLNDSLEIFRSAGVIPGGFRVNHCDGALGANAEAIGFRAMDQSLGAAKLEFLEAVFKKLPGCHSFFGSAAFSVGGCGAEENMTFIFPKIECLGGGR